MPSLSPKSTTTTSLPPLRGPIPNGSQRANTAPGSARRLPSSRSDAAHGIDTSPPSPPSVDHLQSMSEPPDGDAFAPSPPGSAKCGSYSRPRTGRQTEVMRMVHRYWEPVEEAVRTRQPKKLEIALRDMHGSQYLRTIHSVRRSTGLKASERHAVEMELAARLVRARVLLGKWQAGMREIREARDSRDSLRLEKALRKWAYDRPGEPAIAEEDSDVAEARVDLERWNDLAMTLPVVLKDAIEKLDVQQLRTAMNQLSSSGPKGVEGSFGARKMLGRYDLQVKAINDAVGSASSKAIKGALEMWSFGDEEPSLEVGRAALHKCDEQKAALKLAVERGDGAMLQKAVSEWSFERDAEEFMEARCVLNRYEQVSNYINTQAMSPGGLPQLADALSMWDFAEDDPVLQSARGMLDAFEDSVRRALADKDGWMVDRLCSSGKMQKALQAGNRNQDRCFQQLSTLVVSFQEQYAEAVAELRDVLQSAEDLTADMAPDILQLCTDWKYAQNDPNLQVALSWLQFHKAVNLQNASALRKATQAGDVFALQRLLPVARKTSPPGCTERSAAESTCHVYDEAVSFIGAVALDVDTRQLKGALDRSSRLDDLLKSVRDTVGAIDNKLLSGVKAMTKPIPIVHSVLHMVVHVLAGISPHIREPPRDTDWRTCQKMLSSAPAFFSNLLDVPDWIASGHTAGVSRARSLALGFQVEYEEQWSVDGIAAKNHCAAYLYQYLVHIFTYADMVQASAAGSPRSSGRPSPTMMWECNPEYSVEIQRSEAQKFGMALGLKGETSQTVVTEIKPAGRVEEWNSQNPTRSIDLGDVLLSVNGKTEHREMLDEMKSSTAVSIKAQRSSKPMSQDASLHDKSSQVIRDDQRPHPANEPLHPLTCLQEAAARKCLCRSAVLAISWVLSGQDASELSFCLSRIRRYAASAHAAAAVAEQMVAHFAPLDRTPLADSSMALSGGGASVGGGSRTASVVKDVSITSEASTGVANASAACAATATKEHFDESPTTATQDEPPTGRPDGTLDNARSFVRHCVTKTSTTDFKMLTSPPPRAFLPMRASAVLLGYEVSAGDGKWKDVRKMLAPDFQGRMVFRDKMLALEPGAVSAEQWATVRSIASDPDFSYDRQGATSVPAYITAWVLGLLNAAKDKPVVTVKLLSGEIVANLQLDPTMTVVDLKQRLASIEGTAVKQQRLLFAGQTLDDSDDLKAVSDGVPVTLIRLSPTLPDLMDITAQSVVRGSVDANTSTRQSSSVRPQEGLPTDAAAYFLFGPSKDKLSSRPKKGNVQTEMLKVLRAAKDAVLTMRDAPSRQSQQMGTCYDFRLCSEPFALDAQAISDARVPLANLAVAKRALLADDASPVMDQFVGALNLFFNDYLPLRAAWEQAVLLDAEAQQALECAEKIVSLASSFTTIGKPRCTDIEGVRKASSHAMDEICRLAEHGVALPAMYVEYIRHAIDSAGMHLLSNPPAADPGARIHWSEEAMALQLAPLPHFAATLKKMARSLCLHELALIGDVQEVPPAEVVRLVAAVIWVIEPECRCNSGWVDVKLLLSDPVRLSERLQAWSPVRDASFARINRARDLLLGIWGWVAAGCGGSKTLGTLFAWVSLIVAFMPIVDMGQRLTPVYKAVKQGIAKLKKVKDIQNRQAQKIAKAKAWTAALFLLDGPGEHWWWLRLIRPAEHMDLPWTDGEDGGVGESHANDHGEEDAFNQSMTNTNEKPLDLSGGQDDTGDGNDTAILLDGELEELGDDIALEEEEPLLEEGSASASPQPPQSARSGDEDAARSEPPAGSIPTSLQELPLEATEGGDSSASSEVNTALPAGTEVAAGEAET